MTSPSNDETLLTRINADLKAAYLAEESFWKQRSRNLWLSLGDRNSGYFHAVTKGRKAKNNFSVLENSEGTPVFTEQEITGTIVNYFKNLFNTVPGNRRQVVMEALTNKVSPETNQELIMIPSASEIYLALLAIHPDKAPGPDGFSASFFQSNWSSIGPDIVSEIQDFFSSGVMPRSLNHTHVRLIPKNTEAQTVADYRPIALCNVYYKVISKLLGNRLKKVLPELISENQSAFVQDRAITDNILISHEILHYLKTSTASKRCSMAVKIDMSKAYDRLE